jgi:hypothetical protein
MLVAVFIGVSPEYEPVLVERERVFLHLEPN